MTPRFKYLTINAFRREFFAAGSRPRKSDIMRWIDGGTLPAIKIDGVVYIHTDDAAAFFTGAAYHTAPAQDTACKNAIFNRRARVEAARAALAKYGL